jgi:hypothetical protein
LNGFYIWFSTGFAHIADLQGYDHILFLVALCGSYTLKEWKGLLMLITAFTIGHSLTLALSVLRIINIDAGLVEFLIPVTILFTCMFNLYKRNEPVKENFGGNYWLALIFGLIHGLGFSTLLRSLLGSADNILSPLFAFNIGLEAGQLIILTVILLFSVALTSLFKIQRNRLDFFISSAVFGIAFMMAVERFGELVK